MTLTTLMAHIDSGCGHQEGIRLGPERKGAQSSMININFSTTGILNIFLQHDTAPQKVWMQ